MSKKLYPAEFIFPGHPDKLSDAIADALVEQAWRRDPRALVGVEVAVHRDHVYITGRVACPGATDINVTALVQEVYRTAGYDENWYPAPQQVQVVSNLCLGPLEVGESEFRVSRMTKPSVSAMPTTSKQPTTCRLNNGWWGQWQSVYTVCESSNPS